MDRSQYISEILRREHVIFKPRSQYPRECLTGARELRIFCFTHSPPQRLGPTGGHQRVIGYGRPVDTLTGRPVGRPFHPPQNLILMKAKFLLCRSQSLIPTLCMLVSTQPPTPPIPIHPYFPPSFPSSRTATSRRAHSSVRDTRTSAQSSHRVHHGSQR